MTRHTSQQPPPLRACDASKQLAATPQPGFPARIQVGALGPGRHVLKSMPGCPGLECLPLLQAPRHLGLRTAAHLGPHPRTGPSSCGAGGRAAIGLPLLLTGSGLPQRLCRSQLLNGLSLPAGHQGPVPHGASRSLARSPPKEGHWGQPAMLRTRAAGQHPGPGASLRDKGALCS